MKKGVREGGEGGRGHYYNSQKRATTPAVRAIPENLCPNDKIHTGSGLRERRKKSREMKKEEEGVGRKGRKKRKRGEGVMGRM